MILNIFRGTSEQVAVQPIIDRQIVLDKDRGIIYVDDCTGDNPVRRPYTFSTEGFENVESIIEAMLTPPRIASSGNWIIGGVETSISATGPAGPTGPQGAIGPRGLQGVRGPVGPKGSTGMIGPPGADGKHSLLRIKYSQNEYGLNSSYIYNPTIHKYIGIQVIRSNTEQENFTWLKFGGTTYYPKHIYDNGEILLSFVTDPNEANISPVNIKGAKGDTGPQGIQGNPGPGINMKGIVASVADLPTVGEQGDCYIVTGAERHCYIMDSSNVWQDGGNLQGPQGPKGDKGDTGNTGNQGIKGDPGPEGKSTFQIWQNLDPENRSESTQEDMIKDLKGPKGDKGDTPSGSEIMTAFLNSSGKIPASSIDELPYVSKTTGVTMNGNKLYVNGVEQKELKLGSWTLSGKESNFKIKYNGATKVEITPNGDIKAWD